jgi:hypothetical protein
MDDPAPPVDPTIMACPRSTDPSLSVLPVEMLDKIFRLVDNTDLVNLRLVSRSFCAIANRPFAVRYFSSCHHVFTQHSFETLLAISAHHAFGACIKKLMFSPARVILEYSHPYDEDDEDTVVDDSFVESGGFSDLMQKILVNIKRHSDSITRGIYEHNCLGRGHRDSDFHDIDCHSPHFHDLDFVSAHRQGYHGKRAFCESKLGTAYRTSETLKLLVSEVYAAAIDINGLEFFSSPHFPENVTTLKTFNAVAKFLKSHDTPINLHISWSDNGKLQYNHLQHRISFSESSMLLSYASCSGHVRFVQRLVSWLARMSLSELCLRDLDIEYLSYLEATFVRALEKVTLEDIRFGSDWFARDSYSKMFQHLSKLPDLKHCKFDRLHYALPLNESSSHQYNIRTYNSGDYASYWDTLLLIFPDGKLEFEIQGGDTLEKLKDLAAYTAAAERRKIHEVDASGKLVDCRVMGHDTPTLEEEDLDYPTYYRPVVLTS